MALYKNWPEICRIGYKNRLLMLVFASASTDENDEITLGLWLGFQQCFSETKIDGPFPLSIIREMAQERAQQEGVLSGADYPDSWDVLRDLNVPSILFEVCEPGEQETGWPLLPIDLAKTFIKQGDICEWKGQKMVLLENYRNEKFNEWRVVLAPAECIALTCSCPLAHEALASINKGFFHLPNSSNDIHARSSDF